MSFFSWFQTSDKAINTGLDLIKDASAGIDMLWFTDEERAIQGIKIMDQALEFNSKIRDENSVRARARRFLAIIIVVNYILIVDFGIIWMVFKNAEQGKAILTLSSVTFGTIVLCVVISYFGYYGGLALLNGYKKKKG